MAMRIILTAFALLVYFNILTAQLYAQNQGNAAPAEALYGKQDGQAYKGEEDCKLEEQEKERRKIELETALIRARLERELVELRSEIERARVEKEAMALKWALERERYQQEHEQGMLVINQQKEKLMQEIELSQVKLLKTVEKFNLSTIELCSKLNLLETGTKQLYAEMEQTKVRKERAQHADGEPVYLKEPLGKDGILVISDRCIELNGVITPWKANYIVDRIQYFNNKDSDHPIFVVIGSSPGGSVMAGWRIIKAIQNSQAPVQVIIKSFAASMAACIASLAEKSYAYPNAVVLHHQPCMFTMGSLNVREQKELYEELKKWWERIGGSLAKKMGVSLQELDKKFYEKSVHGDWSEFAEDAKDLKWIDNVIDGIHNSSMRKMPDPTDYTDKKYYEDYFSSEGTAQDPKSSVIYLPQLDPRDFYFLYNPNNLYQLRSGN